MNSTNWYICYIPRCSTSIADWQHMDYVSTSHDKLPQSPSGLHIHSLHFLKLHLSMPERLRRKLKGFANGTISIVWQEIPGGYVDLHFQIQFLPTSNTCVEFPAKSCGRGPFLEHLQAGACKHLFLFFFFFFFNRYFTLFYSSLLFFIVPPC